MSMHADTGSGLSWDVNKTWGKYSAIIDISFPAAVHNYVNKRPCSHLASKGDGI